ncbi:MAG TPA: helix-turn-helix domain-containing protein, partial [Pseudomonadota bacterium]|nr:helix-turn-helix domain-containing protein [Pseudomonadota bacterium]
LLKRVRQGHFRADLYHRLVAARLYLPPLRERRPDIALLAEEALQQAAKALGRPAPRLDAHAVELLAGYGWPGNVRELFNVLEQALVRLGGRAELRPADLTGLLYAVQPAAPVEIPLGSTLAEAERQFILQTLVAHQGLRQAAADTLKISRRTLYAKLAAYKRQGLDARAPGDPRPDGLPIDFQSRKGPGGDGFLGCSTTGRCPQRELPAERRGTP